MKAVTDREAPAALLPFARRHGFMGDEQVVQPAGAGKAKLEACIEHIRRLMQDRAGMVERHRCKKVLGRQTAPAAEQIGKRARGRPCSLGDRLDARLRVEVLRDKGDRPPHGLIVVRRYVD
jgi:hypothetical protein